MLAGAVAATVALIGSLVLAAPAAAVPTAALAAVDTGIVQTAAVAGFNPENIISDTLFYDGNAMSSAEIQAFLDAKIGSCSNGKCLNVLNVSISSRDAWYSAVTGDLVCSSLQGGTMRTSELIYRVQVACGISAKAILVTLQKEQGLTTSSAPSDWNLQAAMGASCPDTSPCDPAYSGVGPQIVQGVRQLKIYKAGRFGKQPGVNFIGYSPNAACGGTNLNIQNYATAALYNYTPYQPNAASLAAGWGLGDGCSSYGNRNFFNYYTSWFGSTQTPSSILVRTQSSDAVYLLDSTTRRQVVQYEDWVQLNAAVGPTVFVSDSYLASFTNIGTASAVLRDPSTGSMALIQDGQRRGFSSCDQVARWGASCGSPANISPARYQSIPEGQLLTEFFTVNGSDRWASFTGPTSAQPYFNIGGATAANNGVAPVAARLPAWRWNQLQKSTLRFAPGQLVRGQSKDAVYMTDGWSRLLWVADFGDSEQYGRSVNDLASVSDADLAGYAWNGRDQLLPFATCGGQPTFAAGATLHPQDHAGPAELTVSLADDTCRTIGFGAPSAGELYLLKSGSPQVFLVRGGSISALGSWPAAYQSNSGRTPVVLTATVKTLSRFSQGPAVFLEPSLIRSYDLDNVYLAMGSQKVGLPSFGLARDIGLKLDVGWYATAEVDSTPTASRELSSWVACGSDILFAAGGALRPVDPTAASGFVPTPLSMTTCGSLQRSSERLPTVFVKGTGPSVLIAQDGQYRPIETWPALLRLTGGIAPTILTVDDGVFGGFPRGSSIG